MTALPGALRYEWRRITTIRSSWIIIVLTAMFAALFTWVLSLAGDIAEEAGTSLSGGWSLLTGAAVPLGTVLVSVIGAQAIGQEYRYGIVRLTLTAFPSRTTVAVAKTLVAALFTVIAALAGLAAAFGSARLVGLDFDPGAEGIIIIRYLLYLVLYAWIALTVAGLTRNLILGVVLPLVFALIVEPALGAVPRLGEWAQWLPFQQGAKAIGTDTDAWTGLGVFGLWVAGLWIVWLLGFRSRDA